MSAQVKTYRERIIQNLERLKEIAQTKGFSTREAELAREYMREARSRLQSLSAPMPAGLGALWILSGENPEAFKKYLQTFPKPEFQEIAASPKRFNRAVYELARKVTPESPGASQGIPESGLQSSNVYGFRYSPKTGRLLIKFNGKNSRETGPIYEYGDVPPFVFKMLRQGSAAAKTVGRNRFGAWWRGKTPSLGAAVWQLVRDVFPFRKLS